MLDCFLSEFECFFFLFSSSMEKIFWIQLGCWNLLYFNVGLSIEISNAVVVIGLLIAICVNTNDGAVSVMPVKLGTNVDIDFGKEVKAVRIDVNGERKHIVEDGALTEFGVS